MEEANPVEDWLGVADQEWPTMADIEGRYVSRVLDHTSGNKQAAARLLDVDRKTLDRMIKRHHIESRKVGSLRPRENTPQSQNEEEQKTSA